MPLRAKCAGTHQRGDPSRSSPPSAIGRFCNLRGRSSLINGSASSRIHCRSDPARPSRRVAEARRHEGGLQPPKRLGWGQCLTQLPSPLDRGDPQRSPGQAPSLARTLSVSHHLPSLGRLLLSGSQVARRLPGRHSSVTASPLRCRTGLSRGAQRLGKTATLVPSRWSFARRHMLDTLADWRGLQRLCGGKGGRGLFAPQLTYPGSSWEQGSHLPYTPTGWLRWRQLYRLIEVVRTVG